MSVDPSDMSGPCDLCETATVFDVVPCASCEAPVCAAHRFTCDRCGDQSCLDCRESGEPGDCYRCDRERTNDAIKYGIY